MSKDDKAKELREYSLQFCLITGIVFLFASVLCYIAANWNEFSFFLKAFALALVILACGCFSALKGFDQLMSKVALVFASLLVGVLLALYWQHFGVVLLHWKFFLVWLLFCLPVFILAPNLILLLLCWGLYLMAARNFFDRFALYSYIYTHGAFFTYSSIFISLVPIFVYELVDFVLLRLNRSRGSFNAFPRIACTLTVILITCYCIESSFSYFGTSMLLLLGMYFLLLIWFFFVRLDSYIVGILFFPLLVILLLATGEDAYIEKIILIGAYLFLLKTLFNYHLKKIEKKAQIAKESNEIKNVLTLSLKEKNLFQLLLNVAAFPACIAFIACVVFLFHMNVMDSFKNDSSLFFLGILFVIVSCVLPFFYKKYLFANLFSIALSLLGSVYIYLSLDLYLINIISFEQINVTSSLILSRLYMLKFPLLLFLSLLLVHPLYIVKCLNAFFILVCTYFVIPSVPIYIFILFAVMLMSRAYNSKTIQHAYLAKIGDSFAIAGPLALLWISAVLILFIGPSYSLEGRAFGFTNYLINFTLIFSFDFYRYGPFFWALAIYSFLLVLQFGIKRKDLYPLLALFFISCLALPVIHSLSFVVLLLFLEAQPFTKWRSYTLYCILLFFIIFDYYRYETTLLEKSEIYGCFGILLLLVFAVFTKKSITRKNEGATHAS